MSHSAHGRCAIHEIPRGAHGLTGGTFRDHLTALPATPLHGAGLSPQSGIRLSSFSSVFWSDAHALTVDLVMSTPKER